MPHKVFISYALEDKLVADAACAALEAHRIPCWIAPRDFVTLEENNAAVTKMLSHCQVVLLIYSATSIESPDVRREIDWAMSMGKIIAPFRIANIPSYHALKFGHNKTHWLDALTPPLENYIVQLCSTVSRLVAQQNTPQPPLWNPQGPAAEFAVGTGAYSEPMPQEPVHAANKFEQAPGPSRESFPEPVTELVTEPFREPFRRSASWPESEASAEPEVMEPVAEQTEPRPIPLPIYSWPAPPQSSVPDLEPAPDDAVEEPAEQIAFWTHARVLFTVILFAVILLALLLFMRQSSQSPIKANAAPTGNAQSQVAPFMNPPQLSSAVANIQEPKAPVATATAAPSEPAPGAANLKITHALIMTQHPSDVRPQSMGSEKTAAVAPFSIAPAAHDPPLSNKLARTDSSTGLTWTDPTTGLMWEKADSGESKDLSWSGARDYCKTLQLEGHSDWLLPTIDELQGIYDPGSTTHSQLDGSQPATWHVKGGLELTGPEWSSTPGEDTHNALYLSFDGDKKFSAPVSSSFSLRALCVRRVTQ